MSTFCCELKGRKKNNKRLEFFLESEEMSVITIIITVIVHYCLVLSLFFCSWSVTKRISLLMPWTTFLALLIFPLKKCTCSTAVGGEGNHLLKNWKNKVFGLFIAVALLRLLKNMFLQNKHFLVHFINSY